MKTIEERIAELEAALIETRNRQHRDDSLIAAAAGQLKKARNAKTVEEISDLLVVVAGQLEAVGKGV